MIFSSLRSKEKGFRDTIQKARNVSSVLWERGGGRHSDSCLENIKMRDVLTIGAKMIWVLHCD